MASPAITVELSHVDDDRMMVAVRGQHVGEADKTVDQPYESAQRQAINLALEAQSFRPVDWTGANTAAYAILTGLGLAGPSSFAPDLHERIGRRLFEALFPLGPVREALHKTLDARASATHPARVELRLNAGATVLGAYPWELLYDDDLHKFLFARASVALTRYINYNQSAPELLTVPTLRVLYVAARPIAPEQVFPLNDSEAETVRRQVSQAAPVGDVELVRLPPASALSSTFGLLQEFLTPPDPRLAPHVLHFDGHGGFGLRCAACGSLNGTNRTTCFNVKCGAPLSGPQAGYLAFERKDRGIHWVSADELANLVEGSNLRLVVLSACLSAAAAGDSLFNGVAPALISAGIPAVVGMKYSILDEAATCFAEVFYRNLAQRASLTATLSQVRARLKAEHPNSWYRPVLYLRTGLQDAEGRLFAKQRKPAKPKPGPGGGDAAGRGGVTIIGGDFAVGDIIKNNVVNLMPEAFGATCPTVEPM